MTAPKQLPSVETLREIFSYDPGSGLLIWRVRAGVAAPIGSVAGRISQDGYLETKFKGQMMRVHRIIWKMTHGRDPDCLIDHKDGNKLNNRLENLREATYSQNVMNSKRPISNTSGLKGARRHQGKWMCTIIVRGKPIYLGMFDTKEQAHAVYCEAAAKYHGEFARTQ